MHHVTAGHSASEYPGLTTGLRRASAVALAAAQDINDELTIIASAAQSLGVWVDDPGVDDIRQACQRIAWKAAGLLTYAARHGAAPQAWTMEMLVNL